MFELVDLDASGMKLRRTGLPGFLTESINEGYINVPTASVV
jgi:hypothetical protein